MLGKCFLVFLVLGAFTLESIEGKRLLLRPISASTVRQILKDANREDALPEGRVISHGLAAVKGFALGFKKGVIGVALADSFASSNNSSSSSVSVSKPSFSYNGTTHEICFTSRSATSDIVGEGEFRQVPTTAPTTAPTGIPTTAPTTGTTATTLPTTNPTTTGTAPVTSTTNTNIPTTTGTMTQTNTGTGTGTQTATGVVTTTQTGGGTVNCIVFNKN